MNNTTSWTDLDLSSLRRVGTEFHGACPVTSTGTDGFWINPGKRLIGCRHCSTNGGGLDAGQFTAHLDALGGAESAPPALTTAEWTDVITGDTVVQTRTGQTDPKYLWPHRTKVANLVYLARYEQEADRPHRLVRRREGGDRGGTEAPSGLRRAGLRVRVYDSERGGIEDARHGPCLRHLAGR